MLKIDPTAIIGPNILLGKNIYIGPYSVIRGNTSIGDGTYISSHVSIGEPAEHSSDKYELQPSFVPMFSYSGKIFIGNNVVIREFTTVNQPMKDLTKISNNCYIM